MSARRTGEPVKSRKGRTVPGILPAVVGLCIATLFTVAHAQGPASTVENPRAISEIDDPHTGARWFLLPDPSHPGGPGRMALMAGVERDGHLPVKGSNLFADSSPIVAPLRPVIRGGDRLIVVDRTAVVEARLEAIAVGPATLGSSFQARLRIGGRMVRVVASGPGRAVLAPGITVQP